MQISCKSRAENLACLSISRRYTQGGRFGDAGRWLTWKNTSTPIAYDLGVIVTGDESITTEVALFRSRRIHTSVGYDSGQVKSADSAVSIDIIHDVNPDRIYISPALVTGNHHQLVRANLDHIYIAADTARPTCSR